MMASIQDNIAILRTQSNSAEAMQALDEIEAWVNSALTELSQYHSWMTESNDYFHFMKVGQSISRQGLPALIELARQTADHK